MKSTAKPFKIQRASIPTTYDYFLYDKKFLMAGETKVHFFEALSPELRTLTHIHRLNLHINGCPTSYKGVYQGEVSISIVDKEVLILPIAEMFCKLGEFRGGYPTRFYYDLKTPFIINPYEYLTCTLSYLDASIAPCELYFSCAGYIRYFL